MVENGEPPEAAGIQHGIKEAVDHGQAVSEQVGQADADQIAGTAIGRGQTVFDQMGTDGRVLDHGNIVEPAHTAHAAARMTAVKVASQQVELFRRGLRLDQIA